MHSHVGRHFYRHVCRPTIGERENLPPSHVLHVRGVGGELEDEGLLQSVFEQFVNVVQATVRLRIGMYIRV